jgi:uncharacterized phage-associated protein
MVVGAMPHDAREIANFFIDKARTQDVTLTHLSLQKILYFAHAWHLAKYDRPLLGHRFEAWQFGPVIRVVFDQLKDLKARNIDRRLQKIDPSSGRMVDAAYQLTNDEQLFLKNIFAYYAQFDARKLVDLTHERDGPWDRVWKTAGDRAVVGMYIPDNSIKLWILRDGGREDMIRH